MNAAAGSEREILLFELAGERFALPSADVREVVRAVTIAPLPKAPAVVEGLIDLRGRVVPVLDLRARFGIAAKPLEPSDHLIIAAAAARLVAIRVDRAIALVWVEDGHLQTPETIAPHIEHVAGVAQLPDGLALIHDLCTFLTAAEASTLDEALRASSSGAPE